MRSKASFPQPARVRLDSGAESSGGDTRSAFLQFRRAFCALGHFAAALYAGFVGQALHPRLQVVEALYVHSGPVPAAHPRVVGDVRDAVGAGEVVTVFELPIQYFIVLVQVAEQHDFVFRVRLDN